MKLILNKQENKGIEIKLKDENGERNFSYVEMIEYLHTGKQLEDTEYIGLITAEEKEKINEMIGKINESVIKDNATASAS